MNFTKAAPAGFCSETGKAEKNWGFFVIILILKRNNKFSIDLHRNTLLNIAGPKEQVIWK